MLVQDIMVSDLVTVRPTATIAGAAAIMMQSGSPLLFVSDKERLLGIITDADILYGAVAQGFPTDMLVWQFMDLNPPIASPDMDIFDLITLMDRYRITKLPVVSDGRLLGTVTLADIAARLDII